VISILFLIALFIDDTKNNNFQAQKNTRAASNQEPEILLICNRKGVECDRRDYRHYQPYAYTPSYNWSSHCYLAQLLNLAPNVEPSASAAIMTPESSTLEELIAPESLQVELN
jgi:hypothetical protein